MSGFTAGATEFVPGKKPGIKQNGGAALDLSSSLSNGQRGAPSAYDSDPVLDDATMDMQAAWSAISTGNTSEQESNANKLASLLKEHGPYLLSRPVGGGETLLTALQSALEAEGGKGATGPPRARMGALIVVKVLSENVGAWFEPYAIHLLRRVLSSFKGARVQIGAAEEAARAIIHLMSPHGIRPTLHAIFDGMVAYEWQVKEGSIGLLAEVASSERGREQVGKLIPDVILKLIESLSDTRPAVKNAALKVFPEVCKVVSNTDVKGIIPIVIQAYADPSKTEGALEALSACSFIQVVDAPTLGLILPILMRGMKERKALTKRKCALIIGNMCKLVADPRDAAHFYPVLQPILDRAIDDLTNEDAKVVCARALERLTEVRGVLREKTDHAEDKARILPRLRHAVNKFGKFRGGAVGIMYEDMMNFIAEICSTLMQNCILDPIEWQACTIPYLSSIMSEEAAEATCTYFMNYCATGIESTNSDAGTDEGEDVVNTEFSLGYGGKILLHNTRLWLKRGRRYGTVGKNGCGKTTLMRNIANGSLDGLPEGLKTIYVESNPASHLDTPVAEFVIADPILKGHVSLEQAKAKLAEFGFPAELQVAPLSSLSGGWGMKLALAQAMLSGPDMLLLDEPTNHLDVNAVKWLTDYLRALKQVTVLMVSHSTSFLDDVCTDIIHYDDQKLIHCPGNLSNFVRQRPDAKHFYELSTETLKFNFPIPGRLEGVNSRTQTILKMENVTFTYPGRETPQLKDVTLRGYISAERRDADGLLSRQSRVAVVGANGAGKSTLIKLLVGETTPDLNQGEVWKHHNLRVAYVAQHSFHHVELHLEKSPVDYFKWRFANGFDREIMEKEAFALTDEEKAKLNTDKWGTVEQLRNRRTRHGVLEYEVKFHGMHERENKYWTKEKLEAEGYGTLVKQCDERVAAEAAGLDLRPLITKFIQTHLDDFGLEQDFGTYGKIGGLSGGQKVKLVLAAAMWNCPHLLVLDEPTNFLDREALGAFATAIKEFQGGVIMVSHDHEFMSALCTETWLVEDGEVDIVEEEMVEGKLVRKKRVKKAEDDSDEAKLMNAGGNMNKAKEHTVELDFWGKPLSKAELRRRAKAAKAAGKK